MDARTAGQLVEIAGLGITGTGEAIVFIAIPEPVGGQAAQDQRGRWL
jgi:hypothetical protein